MRRTGVTLAELLLVLVLLGTLLAVTAPRLAALADAWAVHAARDALAAELRLARALALAHGGASLELDAVRGTTRILDTAGRPLTQPLALVREHRVELRVSGADVVHVRYDALGIGRLANRTIGIRRGRFEAHLVISAYGRVRT